MFLKNKQSRHRHQNCGTIRGAIDDVHLGNIPAMLANMKPAIAMSQNFEGEKFSKNDAFVKTVNKNNIRNTMSQIRAKSEILKEIHKIVGVNCSLLIGKLESISNYLDSIYKQNKYKTL